MGEATEARPAEQTTVEQGSMIEPVFEDGIRLAKQRRHDTQIGHIARGKQQGAFTPRVGSQGFFQILVGTLMTAHQMGGAAAHPPVTGGPLKGSNHLRVIGQPQIIIAAEIQVITPCQTRKATTGAVHHQRFAETVLLAALFKVSGEIKGHC